MNMPTPMPLARMAVTSLSAASRLSPIRMPTSTPIGMVMVKVGGKGVEEDFGNAGQGRAVADHQLQQPPQIAHEDDEGEQRHADQGVRRDLLQDVAGENAHN